MNRNHPICYDNGEPGIVLISSLSAGIEDNECWANGAGGIVLQRDDRWDAQPSDALIRGNQCHHNQKGSGIILFSSLSAGIEDNECWGNGAGGIVLQRDDRWDAPPSEAPIRDNRCLLHSAGCGIAVVDSDARLEDNACFANAADYHLSSLAAQALPASGRGTPSPLAIALTNVTGNADEADLLAGFLRSGCGDCFARYWKGIVAGRIGSAIIDEGAADEQGWYRIILAERPDDIIARPERYTARTDEALGRLRDRCFARTGPGRGGGQRVAFAALVNPDDAEIERAAALLQVDDGDGNRCVKPALIVPAASRAGTAPAVPLATRIEEALLAGRSRWRDRLLAIVSHPLFWFAVGLTATAFVFHAKLGIDHAVNERVKALYRPKTFVDLADLFWRVGKELSKALVFPIIFVIILNRLIMPPTLAFSIGKKDGKLEGKIEHLVTFIQDALFKWLGWPKNGAWLKLVRRRLMKPNAVIPIVLHGVEEIPANDRVTLEEIAGLCPPTSTMMIVHQLDDRSLVRPLFLDAMAEKPWRDGLDLMLDDDRGRFTLSELPAPADNKETAMEALFGIPPGGRQDQLIGNFMVSSFSLLDLLPTFALGSAAAARFTLAAKNVADRANVEDEFTTLPSVYATVLDAKPPVPIDEAQFRRFHDWSTPARNLLSVSEPTASDNVYRFIGRIGSRRPMAALMRTVLPNAEEASEFIAGSIACGIANVLNRAEALLDAIAGASEDEARSLSRRLTRGFDAIVSLVSDLSAVLGCVIPGSAAQARLARLLEPMWQRVEGQLGTSTLPPSTGESAVSLYAAFISARFLSLAMVDQPAANAFASRLVDDHDSGVADTASLRGRFLASYHATLRQLTWMEPALARHTVERFLRRDWRACPQPLRDRLDAAAGHGRSLGTLLAAADSGEDLRAVIALHSGSPARLAYLLGAMSSVAADASAETIREVRSKLAIVASWPSTGPDDIGEHDKHDVSMRRSSAGVIERFMASSEATASLSRYETQSYGGEVLSLLGIFDKELDRTLAIVRDIVIVG